MQFFLYFAAVIVGSVLAYALAPKPPRQKPPTLEDFELPTAEEGRAIPWIFGTYKITDPNFIWYGDLEVRTKTKDKVKTRLYRMGTQQEFCISPVDALVALEYGGKDCGITEVTSSQQISINLPNLFGGRDKEGGIDGDFDVCFGEPTQAVNDYLLAQIGAPLSAFRDSLTLVGRKPSWVANSTYIKPLLPTVRCIEAGWEDGACWYPETATVPDSSVGSSEYDALIETLNDGSGLMYRWKLNTAFAADASTEENVGTGGSMPIKREAAAAGSHVTVQGLAAGILCGSDDYSVIFDGWAANVWRATLTVPYFVDGSTAFTIGVWFALHANEGNDSHTIFSTNVDTSGPNYVYQGIWLRLTDSRGLILQFGDATGNGWTSRVSYFSSDAVISDDENANFYVLRYDPVALPGYQWSVLVNGQVIAFSRPGGQPGGSGGALAWHSGEASPRIGFGTGFDGYTPYGYFQEAFLHLGLMSDEDLAAMYHTGTCTGTPDGWDMNPAHIIYKCLTSTDQGAGEPSATIDDASFRAAALTFYTERMGLSLQWRNEGTIRDFLAEVCTHAGAVLTLDPSTGLTQIIPLRDDYTVAALDLYTEDHILEVVEWQDAADGEAVNEVTVEYRKRDASKGTATWVNRASVQEQGVSHATLSFPGITRDTLARRVAKRECLQRSSNLSKGKIKVNRATWNKLPGAVFRFSHEPEGIDELVVRVIDIDLGTLHDGAITISVMQDIFSLDDVITDIGDQDGEWTPPDATATAATAQDVLEAPYWQLLGDLGAAETATLADATGYLVAVVAKPSGLSTGYNVWSRIGAADYVEAASDQAFWPTATLTGALDRASSTGIALTGGIDLDLVEAGWIAMIGTGAAAELCGVDAIDVGAATVNLSRGSLDTTPQEHAASTRVWFLEASATDWPRDPTTRSDAQVVNAKAQTIAGDTLDLADATAMTLTLDSRHVRPYPPGHLAINGDTHPVTLEGDLTVTWAHRDRIAQGATLVSQYDATDYGPEAGTTYNAYAYNDDTAALIDSDTGIAGASWAPSVSESCTLRIEIESVRDGYTSWQRQVRTFSYIGIAARVDVSGTARVDVSDNIRLLAG